MPAGLAKLSDVGELLPYILGGLDYELSITSPSQKGSLSVAATQATASSAVHDPQFRIFVKLAHITDQKIGLEVVSQPIREMQIHSARAA